MEEPHQVKLQTPNDINILSMQQKEEPKKQNNMTVTSHTSEKGVVSSHQGEKISDSGSILTEEFHHVERQTIYSRSSTLPKKEPGKPNRDLDIVLSSEWDIESNHRAGEVHEDERISGINSTLVEESHRVEKQTTDGINFLSMQQK